MQTVKLGVASLNQTPMDWVRNMNNIKEAITKANADNIDILCMPELAITGYGCEDQFQSLDTLNNATLVLKQVCDFTEHSTVIVLVGLPILHHGSVYNCVAVVYNNRIVGIVPKTHLANDGIHYEHRWFK